MHAALIPSPIGPLYAEADEHGLTKLYTDGHRFHADAGPTTTARSPRSRSSSTSTSPASARSSTSRCPSTARRSSAPSGPSCARSPTARRAAYGDIAQELGSVARAVGRANGRNQISIIVPCHRVIGANGSLTGYAGGLDAKRALLEHEQGVGSLYGVPHTR